VSAERSIAGVVEEMVGQASPWVGILWATCEVATSSPDWFDASFVHVWLRENGKVAPPTFTMTHLWKLKLIDKLPKVGGGRVHYTMPRRAEIQRVLTRLGLSSWSDVQALMVGT
jgi:hypothetical protein